MSQKQRVCLGKCAANAAAVLLVSVFVAAPALFAQTPAPAGQSIAPPPSRITRAVDEGNLTRLNGNTHPLAQARFDQGAAPDSLPLNRMLLVLRRSDAQEAALDQLLDQQQDPTSANFHHWLTPQEFGQQYGPSDQDIQTIANWLQSHGFQVNGVSNGRTVVEFSGTAGQVHEAFHTTMHRYTVDGVDHWANSSDPQIPAALAPVVAGINTLYNFPRQAMHHITGVYSRNRATGQMTPAASSITFPNPCNPTSQPFCNFGVGPADFAKIYNVPNLLLSPVPGTVYNGDGQIIAIVGESDVNPQDIAQFRSYFGLPAPNVNVIVSGPDPGIVDGDETESDLDLEWSGAVAPNATIDFVIAESTEASLGVDLAAQYAVDNNLAPVLSESYGICEFFMGTADNQFYSQLWQQAAAEGITVNVSSGDGGSAGCDQNAGTRGAAQFGLTVSGFTSTPYNVSVGGTDFNDLNSFTQFWSTTTGDHPAQSSALSYIPEMTWNDTCTNQEIFSFFGVTSALQACNNQQEISFGLVSITGGSGGVSNCTVSDGLRESSCTGGYAKPSWQSASGVPSDGKRDVPDISLFASNGFNGSFYIICEQDMVPGSNTCDPFLGNSDALGIGGTSASSPAFAGIMALVNQATGSRQGNANYILYKMYGQANARCTSAASPASTCVFYDIPSGSTIAMPCASGSPNVPASSTCSVPAGDTYGILGGYSTGTGYDLATGLGSVNAANLISGWKNFHLTASTTALTLNNGNAVNITHGASIQVSITVSGSGGTPTGNVSLIANMSGGAQQLAGTGTLSGGTATFTTNAIPGGATSVFASYAGDSTFGSSQSTTQAVTVTPEASKVGIAYELFDPNTGVETNPNATTASFGAASLLRINVTSNAGDACAQNSPAALGCPTGSITLTDNGSALDAGTFALNNQGYTEDQTIFLKGGTHNITAGYTGDNSYASCCSPAASDTITVTPAPTSIAVSAFSPVQIGSAAQIEAIISTGVLVPNSSFLPGGTVQFFDGGTALSAPVTYQPSMNPAAQLDAFSGVTFTTPGNHAITAHYSGDSSYAAAGPSLSTTVDVQIPTSLTVTAAPNNVQAGTSVTLTAQVVPTQSGGPAPTGTVTFSYSSQAGSGTLAPVAVANGQASVATTQLPSGSVQITGSYTGDTNYTGSFGSGSETVTPISTTTAITSSNLTVNQGTSVTFTATVTPGASGGPALSGTVAFSQNGSLMGTGAVSNGQAQFTTSSLPTGSLNVQAAYGGNGFYSGSSASLTETVNPAPTFTMSASPSAVSISAPGQSASTTLTFTSQNGLTGSGSLGSATCGTFSAEEITCTLSAFTLPANGTTTATLTFMTTAPSLVGPGDPAGPHWLLPDLHGVRRERQIALAAMLLAMLLAAWRVGPRRRTAFVCAMLALSVLAIGVACGGGSHGPTNPGTPTGNVSPLSVSITINGVTQTVPNLTVTVQ